MAKDLSEEDIRRGMREQLEKSRQFYANARKELSRLQIVLDFLSSLRRH